MYMRTQGSYRPCPRGEPSDGGEIPRGLIIDTSRWAFTIASSSACAGRCSAAGTPLIRQGLRASQSLDSQPVGVAAGHLHRCLGYSVLSNHFHVVLQPDIVRGWSDDHRRRWWNLFDAERRRSAGRAGGAWWRATQGRSRHAGRVAPRRLASISWLMRCLAEPIARRAGQRGWLHRPVLKAAEVHQRLLDESAVLACSVYVDLNPVRASLAKPRRESGLRRSTTGSRAKAEEGAREARQTRQRLRKMPRQARQTRQARRQPAAAVCA